MASKEGQRESNIELCRLVCMFYIVVYHLFIHNRDVTGGLYYTRALIVIFEIGVPVFVLISGYFGIKRSIRGLLNIIAQLLFYNIIAVLLCHFVAHESVSLDNILGVVFPITKTQYWFVSTYILLYILSPYINRVIGNLSKREFVYLLITLTVCVCYWGGVMKGPNSSGRSILLFVFLYCIGRFINLYYPKAELINKYFRKPGFIYIVVMIVYFIIVSFSPTIIARGINYLVYPYNSLFLILFAIAFFFCFKSLHIQNKWINYFAKSSFAIYLIHGQPIVSTHRWIYNVYSHIGLQIENCNLKLLFLFTTALVVCILCVIIDQVRILFFKYAGVDKIIYTIDEYVNSKTDIFKIVE